MKVAYKLKRVCGSVYSNGNIIFTTDGNSVISPVGNQINLFNLVDQTSKTFSFENRKNIARCTLSHNGLFLITVDVEGHALLINFPKQIILSRFHFKRKVYDIKFSPDDTLFAVTFGHSIQIWKTPSIQREFVPLILKRTLGGHHDDTTCIDWSADSNSIIIGSKDLTVRIYHRVKSKKMALHVLSGHRDKIVGAFFAGGHSSESNSGTFSDENMPSELSVLSPSSSSDTVYTLAKDGAIFTWKLEYNDEVLERALSNSNNNNNKRNNNADDDDEEDDYDDSSSDSDDDDGHNSDNSEAEDDEEEETAATGQQNKNYKKSSISRSKTAISNGRWVLQNREFLWDQQQANCRVASAAFQQSTNLLVVGFTNGVFGLYEMPGCLNLQRLSISNSSITAASINHSGEWLVLGSANLSQLLVWEWKSESYILKQQGHLYGMNCVDFSLDGMYLATGGEDAKVKIWSTLSGFCMITLTQHIAPVAGIKFIGKGTGKALLSCSLDGTVRAHDLLRYKNFRTLTTATPMQFTSLASDASGEVVCAGTLDPFQIYVWSLQSGHLLEVLAGHEGPLACLDFSPSGTHLASGSWDGTLKIWDVYKNECLDTLEHGCDVLCVAFRPDGKEVATCATNGTIYIWDVESGTQVSSIEGQRDLGSGRLSTDAKTAANSALSKHFKTVAYSPDGTCILAGGHSKCICLYSAFTGVLLKKFELSHNQSLEGLNRFLRSDRLVDGISLTNITSAQQREEEGVDIDSSGYGGGKGEFRSRGDSSNTTETHQAELPGVASGNRNRSGGGSDNSTRTVKPVFMASAIKFSSSGREWAAATTEGLQVFGLDDDMVFAPTNLTEEATPQSVMAAIKNKNYGLAVAMGLQLTQSVTVNINSGTSGGVSDSTSGVSVLQAAIESVPVANIELVVKSIDPSRFRDLFKFLAKQIMSSTHIEYYLHWCWQVFRLYGPSLQRDAAQSLPLTESLRGLMRAINMHEKESLKYAEQNMYLLTFLASQFNMSGESNNGTNDADTTVVSMNEANEDIDDENDDSVDETLTPPSSSSLFEFKNIRQYIQDHNLEGHDQLQSNNVETSNSADADSDDEEEEATIKCKKSKVVEPDNTKAAANSMDDDIESSGNDDDVWASNWVDDDDEANNDAKNDDDEEVVEVDQRRSSISKLIGKDIQSISKNNNKTTNTDRSVPSHYEKFNGYSVEVIDVEASLLLLQQKQRSR